MAVSEVNEYSHFAQVYDKFLAHVDYPMWANYILDLWYDKNKRDPENILDAACGTGSLIKEFIQKGFIVSGFDLSEEMIDVAKKKLNKFGLKNNMLFVDDIQYYDSRAKFDLVICSFDSLNYVCEIKDLENTIKNIYRLLPSGGMFVFDLATSHLCESYYDGTSESLKVGVINIKRKSNWNKNERLLITEFRFQNDSGNSDYIEQHQQKIYTSEEIVPILISAGFKGIERFGDFSFDPVISKTLRIHYVAEK